MEPPISSSAAAVRDVDSPGARGEDAAGLSEAPESRNKVEDDGTDRPCIYKMRGFPDAASYFEERENVIDLRLHSQFLSKVYPMLRSESSWTGTTSPTSTGSAVGGRTNLMGLRDFIYPEMLVSMVSKNAVRCARATLQLRAPLRGRRADPDGYHPNGFTPLHLAADMFSVEMVRLLLRHGASANCRTKGEHVIEGLLPLHVAVENAAMHRYLEDHWDDGCPLDNLIALLCLPEMKMFLDTTRLIAKNTHNIVDEVWNYVDNKKPVQLAILLLAAQKQLRGPINRSNGKASLNGFESVRHRTYEAIGPLHLQMINFVNVGVKGSKVKKLKQKKEDLLTADALVGIVHKAGEALEEYIQTCSEVNHDEILEHVSSILNSKGIVPSEKGIDTANLKCYQYPWETSINNHIHKIHVKEPPKGLALKEVRNKFFPYWKSVLSARMPVKIHPPCEPSRKDIQRTEKPKKKDVQGTQPSKKGSRRQLCTVASMSLKVLKRA